MADVRVSLAEANGGLPAVCMCCGQPATTSVVRTMRWHPRWVILLAFVHVVLYALVAFLMLRSATVRAPLCDQHKGHWSRRGLLIWGSLLVVAIVGGAAITFGLQLEREQRRHLESIALGIALLFLLWLALLFVSNSTLIHPKAITKEEILLTGVSDEFVSAVVAMDEARMEALHGSPAEPDLRQAHVEREERIKE